MPDPGRPDRAEGHAEERDREGNDDRDRGESDSLSVLHVTGTYLPVRGGAPYFVDELASHLVGRGAEAPVVTTTVGGDPPERAFPVYRAPAVRVAGVPVAPTFPATVARAIRRERPDVVHANYPLPLFPEVATVAALLARVPLVVTGHGAFEETLSSPLGLFGTVYNRTSLRFPLSVAERIHVSNAGIRDEVPAYGPYQSKVEVIPMGVDLDWYDPDRVAEAPPFETDGRPTVLFAGAFRRYKGLDDLIEAFARLAADASLVLIGDGPERERIETAVRERGLDERVTVTGHVSDERLRSAYRHADVFVLPSSTIEESLGLVALEAMAMGTPTVVTSGSGIGRILDGRDAGVVVRPNDPAALAAAIDRILGDDGERDRQGEAGRAFVHAEFDWDDLVDSYADLYRRVLDG